MPHLIYTASALSDVVRLREFIAQKDRAAARRASVRILEALDRLEDFPLIGTHREGLSDNQRELFIDYGKSGYVVLYEVSPAAVLVVSIKHAKEAGFTSSD